MAGRAAGAEGQLAVSAALPHSLAAGSPLLYRIKLFINHAGSGQSSSSNPAPHESTAAIGVAVCPHTHAPPAAATTARRQEAKQALRGQLCRLSEDRVSPAHRYMASSCQQPGSVSLESAEPAETLFSVFVSVARIALGTTPHCSLHPVPSSTHFPPSQLPGKSGEQVLGGVWNRPGTSQTALQCSQPGEQKTPVLGCHLTSALGTGTKVPAGTRGKSDTFICS